MIIAPPVNELIGIYVCVVCVCMRACREGASRGGQETVKAFRALAQKRKADYDDFIACMRQSSAFGLRAKVQRFCKALLEGQRYSRQVRSLSFARSLALALSHARSDAPLSRQETVDIVQRAICWLTPRRADRITS